MQKVFVVGEMVLINFKPELNRPWSNLTISNGSTDNGLESHAFMNIADGMELRPGILL